MVSLFHYIISAEGGLYKKENSPLKIWLYIVIFLKTRDKSNAFKNYCETESNKSF
ncbi:hypothetical protein HMPREF3293_01797 [Christensenella minuta]|uniref:Uncharacterized protein n=1 Tax=Christensenella minuta TaxID=626937 RepID=A0A136Q3C9_9FIRM|nr:hypothetical protein HMPREF3293_01797 [Christensenella minuta]